MNLVDYMSYNHMTKDFNSIGIYGPIKQSLLFNLDYWVINDIINNIEE